MKYLSMVGAGMLALSFAAEPAQAAVLFAGTTAGCFGLGCNTFSQTPKDNPNLLYTFGTFSGSTDDTLAINLGTFALSPGTHDYTNDKFTLEVLFTLPSNVTPNGAASAFAATVKGQVKQGQNGAVSIDFDNTAHSYSWSGGTFTLAIDDVSKFSVGHSNSVTGEITVTSIAAVPEPGTWAMMLLGFAGIGVVTYRRRSSAHLRCA
ncbi:PEPxxWA-CTERM sorting domain-containing protein [Bradyrhizobium sp. WSM1417]|uniref:PEPxxWA-CTERM sorting domain-containing protein n=1 Tax=Bradyrhizobium sp. WSM1417 TaxID=754500 RepID=UPI0004844AE7|nr:PEPxxWA-CTERM sorting domain-containing protein [Bradyrhizobium sp. WSM1417]